MKDNEINAGTATEAREATYVEAARRSGHRWWRYLLGLVVILFSWLVLGTVATVLVAFALGGQEGITTLGQTDSSVFGSFGSFLTVMVGFPFFLAGVLIAVTLIHRRHPRTLITARERVNWRRVGQGFATWFVPAFLVTGLGQYLFYPDSFSFAADFATFALFVPVALVFTAIQTTTEELFFRGYVVQGASLVRANRVFLALAAAVVFTLPHLLNPEAQAGGWLQVFVGYFVTGGLVWVVVSLFDGTTELAIGAHFASNITAALVFSATGSVFTTPALFTISEYHATFNTLSVLVIIPVFLTIAYGVFGRNRQPVSRSHRKNHRDPIES